MTSNAADLLLVPNAPVGLLDPAFYADLAAMHNSFRACRAEAPVVRDPETGLVAVVRHAALGEAERRSTEFVSSRGYRSIQDPAEDSMIAQDDPGHARQRKLVSARFTPRSVRALEPLIRKVTIELVDDMLARGRAEVVTDLAAALPARLTAHLLGFPQESWPHLRSWSERLMRIDGLPHDKDVAAGVFSACDEFAGQLRALADQRRSCPADDVISVWASEMSNRTMFYEAGLFISGGAETTAIARGLRALCDHPDQWDRLSEELASIPFAVEELLRWVSPLNNMFRTAAVNTTLAGVEVSESDRLILLYPSANRDEAVFAEPYRFDTTRSPNHHVAFGFGTHFCLGAALARLELRVVLEELTARMKSLEPLSEPDIEPNIFVGAVRSFELGFRPR